MNRRSFLGTLLGVAGAAAVGDLPAVIGGVSRVPGPTGYQAPTGWDGPRGPSGPPGPTGVYLQPGQNVQEAIDSLGPCGGTVFFSAGTYIVGQRIVIPENVELVGEGDISIIDCHITAASPIVLEGERNRIMNCYLKAEKGLTHFFEIKMERGNAAFGNWFEGATHWIVKPFQEVFDLIREMS
jgi:hypothetical protein